MRAHLLADEQEVAASPARQPSAQPCSLYFQSIKKSGCDKEREAVKLHPYLPDSGPDLAFIYAGLKQK